MDYTRGIFVLFFLSSGFSHSQVGVFQMVLFISILVFEVPSGVIADRYQRKLSLILGLGTLSMGFVGVQYFENFYVVAALFVLKGLGMAFSSGANSALLYDCLKAHGPETEAKYLKISARSRNIGNLALAFAIWAGGVLESQYGWCYTYGAAVMAFFLAALSVALFSEVPHSVGAAASKRSVSKDIQSFFGTKSGRGILIFIAGLSLFEAGATPLYIFAQSYFKSHAVDIPTIG